MSANRQTRREFCRTMATGAAALGLGGLAWGQASGKPMNILMLVAEDMGLQVGCYGDRWARTPNIDALAKTGVTFENAYVTQASCSPSRSSIFTGLFPHQNYQLGLCHRGYRMHRGIPGLAPLLGKAGYLTGVIGKIHVQPEEDVAFAWREKRRKIHADNVEEVADGAKSLIEEAGDKPFFLSVNFRDTHRPFHDQRYGSPKKIQGPDDVGLFPFHSPEADTPAIRKVMAAYYNGVARVDDEVGAIMRVLEASGKADNTVVVFIGDHGPAFARGKLSTYEAGLRIPYIVRWPGVGRQGVVSKALVSTVDFLPTFLDAAGATGKMPEPLAGRSLRPILASESADWRTYNFGEFNSHGPSSFFPRRAVRDARYKYIVNLTDGRNNPGAGPDGCEVWKMVRDGKPEDSPLHELLFRNFQPPKVEFYDLEKDPWEKVNMAGKPEVAADEKRLAAALEKWRRETHDPFLSENFLTAMYAYHDKNKVRYSALMRQEKDPRKRRALGVIDMGPYQRPWAEVLADWRG